MCEEKELEMICNMKCIPYIKFNLIVPFHIGETNNNIDTNEIVHNIIKNEKNVYNKYDNKYDNKHDNKYDIDIDHDDYYQYNYYYYYY